MRTCKPPVSAYQKRPAFPYFDETHRQDHGPRPNEQYRFARREAAKAERAEDNRRLEITPLKPHQKRPSSPSKYTAASVPGGIRRKQQLLALAAELDKNDNSPVATNVLAKAVKTLGSAVVAGLIARSK